MNRESLFSGILIGLGATGYLALGGIPGAVIFAFGLVCVVLFGVPLYTGKAGVTNDIPALVRIWLFNIIGCALLGFLFGTGIKLISSALMLYYIIVYIH